MLYYKKIKKECQNEKEQKRLYHRRTRHRHRGHRHSGGGSDSHVYHAGRQGKAHRGSAGMQERVHADADAGGIFRQQRGGEAGRLRGGQRLRLPLRRQRRFRRSLL